MDLHGKIVLVTGASSGIGYDAARAFARRGSTVIGVARREANLQQLMEECRPVAPASEYRAGDLAERDFAEAVVNETVERHGRLDILVNNAAISKHKHLLHTSADEAEFVMRVNFLSCVWTTFAAIPHMQKQGRGSIVNVSSFAGRVVPPRESIYAASKAAMSAFTEGLWYDLKGTNIHAGLVIPGPIDTEIWLKEDEPPAFDGKKYPASVVTDAIFEVIQKKRYEITAPKRNPALVTARFLRYMLPAILRMGVARMEPNPPELLERARQRAVRGLRLGQSDDDAPSE